MACSSRYPFPFHCFHRIVNMSIKHIYQCICHTNSNQEPFHVVIYNLPKCTKLINISGLNYSIESLMWTLKPLSNGSSSMHLGAIDSNISPRSDFFVCLMVPSSWKREEGTSPTGWLNTDSIVASSWNSTRERARLNTKSGLMKVFNETPLSMPRGFFFPCISPNVIMPDVLIVEWKLFSLTSERYSRNCSSLYGPFSEIPSSDACNCEETCKPVDILISTSGWEVISNGVSCYSWYDFSELCTWSSSLFIAAVSHSSCIFSSDDSPAQNSCSIVTSHMMCQCPSQ